MLCFLTIMLTIAAVIPYNAITYSKSQQRVCHRPMGGGFYCEDRPDDYYISAAWPSFLVPILGLSVSLGLLWWVLKRNGEADVELQSAGQLLASERGLSVKYLSERQKQCCCCCRNVVVFRGFLVKPLVNLGAAIGAAQVIGAAQAAPATMMAVTVPAGVAPGTALQVTAPSGQTLQVAVPRGLGPGQVFQVQLPPAQPVMAAAAVVVAQPMVEVV